MHLADRVQTAFRHRWGEGPAFVVQAPGRVNLIGEHTDYNDGFVLPMAIERATWIALRPRSDRQVVLHSLDHGQDLDVHLDHLSREPMSWREYPKGVAQALQQAGYTLAGWEGVTACDVPMGAGLSSSASFELAVACAFQVVSGFPWDAPRMAVLAQQAECSWVGVKCGVMDQMISAVGEVGRAVLIDCRDLTRQAAPLPPGTAVVILDTMTRRGLVDSAYNERRAQCQAAAAHFKVKALRDLNMAGFERGAAGLDPVTARRARHVITENARTLAALAAMRDGDASTLGRLMNQSHASLRDDFEVTNPALNQMVEAAQATSGCRGARMTGAGFGGCAVALVEAGQAADFAATVSARYHQVSGRRPTLYVTQPAAGAGRIDFT